MINFKSYSEYTQGISLLLDESNMAGVTAQLTLFEFKAETSLVDDSDCELQFPMLCKIIKKVTEWKDSAQQRREEREASKDERRALSANDQLLYLNQLRFPDESYWVWF